MIVPTPLYRLCVARWVAKIVGVCEMIGRPSAAAVGVTAVRSGCVLIATAGCDDELSCSVQWCLHT